MFISTLFILSTLLYRYQNKPYSRKYIYVTILMFIYILLYINTPLLLQERQPFGRYLSIFEYFPIVAYIFILFPHSLIVTLTGLFPELDESLAIKAVVFMSWVTLLFMSILLVGLKLFFL